MGREVEVLSLGMMMRCKWCCRMIHGGSTIIGRKEENRTNADSNRINAQAVDTFSFKLWV